MSFSFSKFLLHTSKGIICFVFLQVSFIAFGMHQVRSQGLIADSAMVVSAHKLASEVGTQIMKAGGNAFDAAIAVQFALAVVYPAAGNIGGGGFMVYRMNDGSAGSLDFREKAPHAAHQHMYLDADSQVISRLSLDGHLAAGVPGTVDGMVEIHKRYGSLTWEALLQPAIDLAANGFLLSKREAEKLNAYKHQFIQFNTIEPTEFTAKQWKSGDTIIQIDLAGTLHAIQQMKREGFYGGQTAKLLIEEINRGNGLITQKDLDDYTSVWREPVQGTFGAYHIISIGPPSSGGIMLVLMLNILEHFKLAKWGRRSWKTIHSMIETERRAYAIRAKYLGDKDFYPVPSAQLISKQFAINLMADFTKRKASLSAEVFPEIDRHQESEETTHFSIIDPMGNAVAITTTLNSSFGSKVVVAGAGFLLNNEMDDFSIKPGSPNLYGLIGGKANAIEPGKRMLSSMTPTIIEKDNHLWMVLGTPGGSTIITSVLQTFLNVAIWEMNMQEAVDALKFHHQWLPDLGYIEEGAISKKLQNKLERKGHTFKVREPIGRVDAIMVLPDGRLEGGADWRGEDHASGF